MEKMNNRLGPAWSTNCLRSLDVVGVRVFQVDSDRPRGKRSLELTTFIRSKVTKELERRRDSYTRSSPIRTLIGHSLLSQLISAFKYLKIIKNDDRSLEFSEFGSLRKKFASIIVNNQNHLLLSRLLLLLDESTQSSQTLHSPRPSRVQRFSSFLKKSNLAAIWGRRRALISIMSTAPSAASSLPAAPEIPVGFYGSLKSWLASGHKEAEVAEERLLRRLSTFRSKNEQDVSTPSTANARISQVPLSNGKSRYINMLSILPTTPAYPLPASKGPAISSSAAPAPSSPSSSLTNDNSRSEAPPTTVILHGYGAGLGFFSLNLEALSSWVSKRGLPVYLLDWLGMGRSARPTFKVSAKPADTIARVDQAESFFLDALEEWRGTMGINKMTLVGHSLGAYLVTAYALKYPQHVSRLVLLSPAGVPAGPNTTVPAAELTRSRTHPEGSEVTQPPRELKNPNSKDVSGIKQEQVREIEEQKEQKEPWTRRLVSDRPFRFVRARDEI
ncbi:6708_t:CDS:2 [Acaulospora colombiana]|uniref:6708_t:CDS:1 n=1 Tax=Acaulospora colombiana TaxID=27376 RepID=A0ACA9MU22_9GLOM|nr:6708_t:CDS:2 [Acaulospora colombiana]